MAMTEDKNSVYKRYKSCTAFPITGNRISWQGSFGKMQPTDFQLIMEHTQWYFHGGASTKISLVWKLRHFGYTVFTSTQENHSREIPVNCCWRDGTELPVHTIMAYWEGKLWRKTPLKYYFLPYLITKQIYREVKGGLHDFKTILNIKCKVHVKAAWSSH